MLKSNREPTQRYKVIIEKPTYAGNEMHSKLLHEWMCCGGLDSGEEMGAHQDAGVQGCTAADDWD